MSMLSAQIDHLRELADALDGKYGYQGYEIELRKAADTICELRGALQVASVDYGQLAAENAKLRQQLEDVTVSMGRVEERCTKLRELAQRADRLLTDLFPHIDYSRCTALEAVAAWRVRARELGVEV